MSDQLYINNLGPRLKELLQERSLSMRKFSEMTDIDKATISRIINGRRKATPEHLQKFAESLGVPAAELFIAAGYPINKGQEQLNSDIHASLDSIQIMLESTGMYHPTFSIENVQQQLEQFHQYSRTEEGKETIYNGFEKKLKKTGSIGPFINHLKEMFETFRLGKSTPVELGIIGSALIYFIISVDVIPDYIFPVGYLDDAIAVKLTLNLLTAKVGQ